MTRTHIVQKITGRLEFVDKYIVALSNVLQIPEDAIG